MENTPLVPPHMSPVTLATIPTSSVQRGGFSLGVLGVCVVSGRMSECSFRAGRGAGLGEEKEKRRVLPHILLLAGRHLSVLRLERWVTLGCLLPALNAYVPDSKQK